MSALSPAAPPGEARPAPPVDASMRLLADIARADDGYAAAAARRRAAVDTSTVGRDVRRSPTLLVLLAAAGLLLATAAVQVRAQAPADEQRRDALAERITERVGVGDALLSQVQQLRTEFAAATERQLLASRAGEGLSQRVTELEVAAGLVPVKGPGLVVTVDDAAADDAGLAAEEADSGPDEGRVFDRDLQAIVNALWAAGAEAVAVDGLRLSSRSAIRAAGEAILVDYRPVSPPYEIRAVGDPERLPATFTDSATAQQFREYAGPGGYGLRFDVRGAEELQLPAAAAGQLARARPAGAGR